MDKNRDIEIAGQLTDHPLKGPRSLRGDVLVVLVLDRVGYRRRRPFDDRCRDDLVTGAARYLRRQVQGRSALTAGAESRDDRHRAAVTTGVATACVTGTPCWARARSTTSKRCHTEASGGNVAITI